MCYLNVHLGNTWENTWENSRKFATLASGLKIQLHLIWNTRLAFGRIAVKSTKAPEPGAISCHDGSCVVADSQAIDGGGVQ